MIHEVEKDQRRNKALKRAKALVLDNRPSLCYNGSCHVRQRVRFEREKDLIEEAWTATSNRRSGVGAVFPRSFGLTKGI